LLHGQRGAHHESDVEGLFDGWLFFTGPRVAQRMADDEPDNRIDDETHVADEDSERDVIEDGDGDAEEAETREFEIERTTTREETAALLHDLADGVASGSVAFDDGTLVVDIPETVDLEVEYEQEDDESEIEVELEWATAGDVDGEDSAESETDDGETGDGGAEIEDSPGGAEESGDAVEDSEIDAEDRERAVESDDETTEEDDETAGKDDEAVEATEFEVESGVESGGTAEPDIESGDIAESEVVGLVEPGGVARSRARFELYRDRADKWRWRLVHHNGNIIADGGGGYTRKANARKGLRSVRRNAPGALVVENE